MAAEYSNPEAVFNSTNADTFHIEDTEVTLLVDPGTRIVTQHLAENMMPLHIHPH